MPAKKNPFTDVHTEINLTGEAARALQKKLDDSKTMPLSLSDEAGLGHFVQNTIEVLTKPLRPFTSKSITAFGF